MSLMMQIGKSGAKAYQNNVNVVAHNLANVSTNGYKKNYVDFKDLIYMNKQLPSVNGTDSNEFFQGSGVRVDGVYEDFSQGSLIETGGTYDYAVSGEGFFAVYNEASNQMLLTRDGSFTLNGNGELVDVNGYKVVTQQSVDVNGEVVNTPLLYKPDLKANMTKLNGGYYAVNENNLISAAQQPELFGEINQGFIEGSNIDMTDEMTNLMIAQRAYTMSMKAIQTADETLQTVSQLR
ncbi:MAG TPA: hypothetical protein DCY20_03285 [Firmicutes bacterium]|nr:hypothetical protein [Bacillota bacterium]